MGEIVECVLWVHLTGHCGEVLLALVVWTGCDVSPACVVWDDTVKIKSSAKLICTNFAKLLLLYESI